MSDPRKHESAHGPGVKGQEDLDTRHRPPKEAEIPAPGDQLLGVTLKPTVIAIGEFEDEPRAGSYPSAPVLCVRQTEHDPYVVWSACYFQDDYAGSGTLEEGLQPPEAFYCRFGSYFDDLEEAVEAFQGKLEDS